MDTININGLDYEVSGYADDGLPIIKATAESVHEGFDDEGYPKISTTINVSPVDVTGTPGENG